MIALPPGFGWRDVPRLCELRAAWFAAPNLGAQRVLAAEIQKVVLAEVPYLPSGQSCASTAWRRNISEPITEVWAFWGVHRL